MAPSRFRAAHHTMAAGARRGYLDSWRGRLQHFRLLWRRASACDVVFHSDRPGAEMAVPRGHRVLRVSPHHLDQRSAFIRWGDCS
ncbi:hypothetical protein CJI59_17360 [Streptomyces sp. Alain-F2R5]|nr:hypothetical protein CJI59_17360 [Streptomyces sp. Alain-F2R5]